MKQTIKPIVINILEKNKSSRDNDNLLIAKTLKKLYGTADMFEVATLTNVSVSESITRMRRRAQENNPLLIGKTKLKRLEKAEEIKRSLKGV